MIDSAIKMAYVNEEGHPWQTYATPGKYNGAQCSEWHSCFNELKDDFTTGSGETTSPGLLSAMVCGAKTACEFKGSPGSCVKTSKCSKLKGKPKPFSAGAKGCQHIADKETQCCYSQSEPEPDAGYYFDDRPGPGDDATMNSGPFQYNYCHSDNAECSYYGLFDRFGVELFSPFYKAWKSGTFTQALINRRQQRCEDDKAKSYPDSKKRAAKCKEELDNRKLIASNPAEDKTLKHFTKLVVQDVFEEKCIKPIAEAYEKLKLLDARLKRPEDKNGCAGDVKKCSDFKTVFKFIIRPLLDCQTHLVKEFFETSSILTTPDSKGSIKEYPDEMGFTGDDRKIQAFNYKVDDDATPETEGKGLNAFKTKWIGKYIDAVA